MRLLVLLLATFAFAPAQDRKPNVVFLLADDLGWADLRSYGSDFHETPNLDRLASAGVRFTQSYTASPVCSPTRASILTGLHPARLHMTIWREAARHPLLSRELVPPVAMDHLPLERETLAEAFKRDGYVTAHIGKWHLGTAPYYPQTQGFDYNIGGTLWGAPQTFFYPYSGDRHFREPRYVPHLEGGSDGEYLTDRLTDEAIQILERHRTDPLYLQLWYHTVHTPIEGRPDLAAKYESKSRTGRKHSNVHYAAMLESLDENVGRVLAKIDELNLTNDTIVVFSSDNGGYINEYEGERVTDNTPLRSGKGSAYEGGLRVPTIFRVPGVTAEGEICDEPISSVDFFTTLLSLAGVEPPSGYRSDGTNITPLLRNPEAELSREAIFFHYPHYYATTSPVSAVRVGDWKLLRYYEDQHLELYDLATDPGERRNRAREHPERADSMLRRLELWLDDVGAQHPTPNIARAEP